MVEPICGDNRRNVYFVNHLEPIWGWLEQEGVQLVFDVEGV